MNRMTIHNREYHHQKDGDDRDVLTYYDKNSQRMVKLKFPRESQMDISDHIIEILSDAFVAEFLSMDSERAGLAE